MFLVIYDSEITENIVFKQYQRSGKLRNPAYESPQVTQEAFALLGKFN